MLSCPVQSSTMRLWWRNSYLSCTFPSQKYFRFPWHFDVTFWRKKNMKPLWHWENRFCVVRISYSGLHFSVWAMFPAWFPLFDRNPSWWLVDDVSLTLSPWLVPCLDVRGGVRSCCFTHTQAQLGHSLSHGSRVSLLPSQADCQPPLSLASQPSVSNNEPILLHNFDMDFCVRHLAARLKTYLQTEL